MNFIFLKSLCLGLSIAATVGPISLLCIRKIFMFGPMSGFVSGLGAASADALYALTAAFGFSAIMNFLITQKMYFSLFGGMFLCYLGYKAFFARPQSKINVDDDSLSLFGDYLTTFFLTLINPMTILLFIALFTSLNLGAEGYKNVVFFVSGVFMGTTLWWLCLAFFIGLFREKITPEWLCKINKISGVIIAGFGFYSLASVILGF